MFRALLLAVALLSASPAFAFITGRDCTGPTITPSGTRIVNVSTISQLNAAVSAQQAGDTIVLASGTYTLTNSLVIHSANVTITSAGPGCGTAILQGGGQDNLAGPAAFGVYTDAANTTVSQLTIRDTYDNTFICNAGCSAPRAYNVKFINAGSQFFKINGSNAAQISNAIVEYSRFEYTAGGPNNHGAGAGYGYFNGISAHGSNNLIVRYNTFINLHVGDTCFSEPYTFTGDPNCYNPAVLVWNGSTNATVEGNLFINVDQGITLGLVQRSGFLDYAGGIARNNVLYNTPSFWTSTRISSATNDGFIRTFEAPGAKVYNNTVISNGTYGKCIVNRFSTSTSVLIRNNACDATINATDLGATATLSNNVTNVTSAAFSNQTNADFHLTSSATALIGTGFAATSDVLTDFDAVARATPYDIGAYKNVSSLVQSSGITFKGKFALPVGDCGQHSYCYGGYGLTFWKDGQGRKTLFQAGNDQAFSWVGQVQVPADGLLKPASASWASLNTATALQPLSDIASTFAGFDPGNGNPDWMMGMAVYNGRLLLAGSNSYSFNQTKALGVWDQPGNLGASVASNFHGFYPSSASAPARAVGGYYIAVPAAWQGALGGPMMVGNCCVSIISTTSFGPALTVINPDDIGTLNPVPGTTLLFYPGPGPNEICGANPCEATTNDYFNLVTRVLGGAFVPGTSSILFVSGHGTGTYCYGTAAECFNDTVMSDVKGPHAQPYRYQIIAYDANDLVKVKNGTWQTYQPKPYNMNNPWVLPEISGTGLGEDPRGHGAAFDPETGRLYIRTLDGNQPTIWVYEVALGSTSNPTFVKLPIAVH